MQVDGLACLVRAERLALQIDVDPTDEGVRDDERGEAR